MKFQAIVDRVRLWDWWIYAVAAIVAVAILAGTQLPVLVWKIALVAAAVLAGYAADRALFYRTIGVVESMPRDVFGAARLLARALVVFAVILGMTQGL